jgi:hypothetical protein
METGLNGGTEAPAEAGRRKRRSGRGRNSNTAIGSAMQPGLGAQLSSRVQSGAIDQGQAQKTMQQRQTLEKAYGKNWRTKVFGDRGYAQRTRKALSKNPDSARLAALNKKLMERRKTMLTKAEGTAS